jgi:hypothetical protein
MAVLKRPGKSDVGATKAVLTAGVLIFALTACGGGGGGPAASPSSSSQSPSTGATTAASTPAEDVAAKGNCVMAGLQYSPIVSGLKGDLDLEGALQYAEGIDLDPATTQPGEDANLALAELGVQVALGHASALTGGAVDRASLQEAYTRATEACALIGGGL